MTKDPKNARTCKNGHRYYKSSDCPVCPICEQNQKPDSGFMSLLSAPARRALEGAGINTLKQVAKHSESQIKALHGFGPSGIKILKKSLEEAGLAFSKKG